MTGTIIKQISNLYTVLTDDGKLLEVRAKGKLRYMQVDGNSPFYKTVSSKTKKELKRMQIEPKVGDRVLLNTSDDTILIDDIEPRKNDLYRPDVSNVDQMLLVFSGIKPDFNEPLLDKFLVILEMYGIQTHIILTKTDLMDEALLKSVHQTLEYYASIGYPFIAVNPKTKEGLDVIKALLKDKISVVSGQTGVGKSTLLNRLIPTLSLQTQEISDALGRGKHTTRHTELFPLAGGLIADTPGFSKLSFEHIEDTELRHYFKEFQSYSCKFSSCLHIHEPSCGIKEAVSNGDILQSRYNSYLSFYETIKGQKKTY